MEAVGYIATTITLLFLIGGVLASVISYFSRVKRRPKLAGTVIPEIGVGFDIQKRYDIAYSTGQFRDGSVERMAAVRIVGYVGRSDDESVSKSYMRGRWLVVEARDGRLCYLMPDAIISLAEAAPG